MASQRQVVQAAGRRYGVDPRILWGVYGTESDYGRNPSTSSAGAVGPWQFLPSTAKGMGVNPYDFRSGAFGAAKYLAQYKKRGTAGMLSAYNAGPAGGLQQGYVNTVLAKSKSFGGGVPAGNVGEPGSSSPGSPLSVQLGVQEGTGPPTALIEQIQAVLKKQEGKPESVASQAVVNRPAHSAGPILPKGAKQVLPIEPAPEPSLASKLQPILEQLATSGTDSSVKVEGITPGEPGAAATPGATHSTAAGDYPLGKVGKVIGMPYQGTHTLYGNWESDNAVDIAAPKGTPVYATGAGTIGSQIGPLSTGGDPRLLGQRLHLVTKGNEWYYAHLSKILVKPGQRVQAGQLLGYSGEANGVQHLHIASKSGSPVGLTRR